MILLGGAIGLVVAAALWVFWQAQRPPANAPGRVRRDGLRPLVVCAGASVTHGRISANYVSVLEARLGESFQFANAGHNGDLAYNLLQRMDAVAALRPEFVLLQIGTNDVNASLSPRLAARYRYFKKLPELPSLDFYHQSLSAIVQRLRAETAAQVALLSLPLLGEDLDSVLNQRVRTYNAVICDVARAFRAAYLPLHETMTDRIRTRGQACPLPFANRRIGVAQVERFLLARSFDQIGTRNGYGLLSDGMHLSGRGAAVVADVIEPYLLAAAPAKEAVH